MTCMWMCRMKNSRGPLKLSILLTYCSSLNFDTILPDSVREYMKNCRMNSFRTIPEPHTQEINQQKTCSMHHRVNLFRLLLFSSANFICSDKSACGLSSHGVNYNSLLLRVATSTKSSHFEILSKLKIKFVLIMFGCEVGCRVVIASAMSVLWVFPNLSHFKRLENIFLCWK